MDVIYKQAWHTGQVLVPFEVFKLGSKTSLGLTLSCHSALMGDANYYL